jgi:hypothetical protein
MIIVALLRSEPQGGREHLINPDESKRDLSSRKNLNKVFKQERAGSECDRIPAEAPSE